MKERIVVSIVTKDDYVLVVERNKNDGVSRSFPSWKIEINESPDNASIRETLEETGVHTNFVDYIGYRTHPTTKKDIIYCLLQYVSWTPTNSNDSAISWAGWKHKNELLTFFATDIYPPVLDVLHEWIKD